MKFGKRLLAEAERRWMTSYVDYKALKRAIKNDVDRQDTSGAAFAVALKSELEKVDAFYSSTEKELETTTDRVAADGAPLDAVASLRSQVHDLRKFVVLNYIAVVKAVKKRNRHLRLACGDSVAVPALRAVDILAGQQFFTSLKLAAISTHVEIISRERTASSEAQASDLQDFMCPICISPLRAPVVLTCAHRFCWGCLMTHCTTVRSTAHHGNGHEHSVSTSKPLSSSVAKPAVWVSEASDDENASVATFACPCCRKDQLLDLDRLQVDPHLDSFMKKMEESGSTVTTTTTQMKAAGGAAPSQVLSLRLEKPAEAATAEGTTQPIAIKTSKPQSSMPMDIDIIADSSSTSFKPSALVAAAVDDVVQPAVADILLPPLVPQTAEKPMALLPPQRPEHCGRLTVCLDLDGTLVTTFTPKRAPTLPASAVCYIVGRGGKLNPGGVFVVERPGLGDFLQRLSEIAEVVLFTAGLEDYASPICDEIERRYGKFPYRLYRPATVHSDEYPCVKDLSKLGRDLGRCLLVDDTPLAFFHQPDCGVPVLQFRGDVDDRLLSEAVTPLIEELAGEADVRNALAKRFNMRRWFAAQGLQVPQAQAAALEEAAAAPASSPAKPPLPPIKTGGATAPRSSIPSMHNAPAAHLLNSTRASEVLLVCDFDKTLTDWDATERLCDELAPELTSLLSQIESPANFVPTTNAVLGEMQRRGVSRDQIVGCLRGMAGEMPASTLGMLRWAARNEVDVRILSDCNSVFIGHILTAAKVHTCVREVITNPSSFQRIASTEQPDTGPAMSGLSAWAAQVGLTSRPAALHHRLVIQPRHEHKTVGSHGCPLCPLNMCKGRELDALHAASGRQRIVYAGDGANDLCPALCLGPEDVVLARAGYPLERLLAQHVKDGGEIAARVAVWENHEELATLVRQAVLV